MTTREARHAIYAAAFGIEEYVLDSTIREETLDAFDQALDALREYEGVLA